MALRVHNTFWTLDEETDNAEHRSRSAPGRLQGADRYPEPQIDELVGTAEFSSKPGCWQASQGQQQEPEVEPEWFTQEKRSRGSQPTFSALSHNDLCDANAAAMPGMLDPSACATEPLQFYIGDSEPQCVFAAAQDSNSQLLAHKGWRHAMKSWVAAVLVALAVFCTSYWCGQRASDVALSDRLLAYEFDTAEADRTRMLPWSSGRSAEMVDRVGVRDVFHLAESFDWVQGAGLEKPPFEPATRGRSVVFDDFFQSRGFSWLSSAAPPKSCRTNSPCEEASKVTAASAATAEVQQRAISSRTKAPGPPEDISSRKALVRSHVREMVDQGYTVVLAPPGELRADLSGVRPIATEAGNQNAP